MFIIITLAATSDIFPTICRNQLYFIEAKTPDESFYRATTFPGSTRMLSMKTITMCVTVSLTSYKLGVSSRWLLLFVEGIEQDEVVCIIAPRRFSCGRRRARVR